MPMHPEQSSFLFGPKGTFIAELYARYLEDPDSVDPSWRSFFADLHDDAKEVLDELRGASWAPSHGAVIGDGAAAPQAKGNGQAATTIATVEQLRAATLDSIRALMLIRVYRVRGHLLANLDPLGLEKRDYHPELNPTSYGF